MECLEIMNKRLRKGTVKKGACRREREKDTLVWKANGKGRRHRSGEETKESEEE